MIILNGSSFFLSDSHHWSLVEWIHFITGFIMVIVGLVGVMTNVFSTVVFLSEGFRKLSINVLLAAMNIADASLLLLATFSFGFLPFTVLFRGRFVHFWYMILMLYMYPLARMSRMVSIWLLVQITIERWVVVCHPLKAAVVCTRSRAIRFIIGTVAFGFVFNVVRFWEFGSKNGYNITLILRSDDTYMQWYVNTGVVAVEYVLPLIIICLLSWRITVTVRDAVQRRRNMTRNQVNEHNITKMLIGIIIIFITCNTASLVLNIVELSCKEIILTDWFGMLSDLNNLLVMFNSASNSLFYYKFSIKYREFLANFLSCTSVNADQENAVMLLSSLTETFSLRHRSIQGSQRRAISGNSNRENENISMTTRSPMTKQSLLTEVDDVLNDNDGIEQIQFLGYNTDLYKNFSDAASKPRGIVAIAVMMDIGHGSDPELQRITLASREITYKGMKKAVHKFSPYNLMPPTSHYVTYEGSLTYPGCYETVTWIIMNKPIYLTFDDYGRWNDLQQSESKQSPPRYMVPNFRPLKDLNNRLIRTNINFKTKGSSACPTMYKDMYYRANPNRVKSNRISDSGKKRAAIVIDKN